MLPGGPTNWGGSWLGVPTASRHKAAAVAFVKWATGKAQQVTMWTAKAQGGTGRRTRTAAADPACSNATNAYFSNAPVGQIFGKIAGAMKIPPIGLYDTPIQNAFTTELTNVETKGTKAGHRVQQRAEPDQADHRLSARPRPGACRPAVPGTVPHRAATH